MSFYVRLTQEGNDLNSVVLLIEAYYGIETQYFLNLLRQVDFVMFER